MGKNEKYPQVDTFLQDILYKVDNYCGYKALAPTLKE
jgi:hypothetical protein